MLTCNIDILFTVDSIASSQPAMPLSILAHSLILAWVIWKNGPADPDRKKIAIWAQFAA